MCDDYRKYYEKVNPTQDQQYFTRGARSEIDNLPKSHAYKIVDNKAMLNQYDDIGNFNVSISGYFDCSDIKDNGCYVNF